MKKIIVAALIVVAVIAGWIASQPSSEIPPMPRVVDQSSLRATNSGAVVGFKDHYETHAWVGIPYASPPVGELRWRAPRPAQKWQATREALNYSQPCPQQWGFLSGVTDAEAEDLVGSEDCLALNIWAPAFAPDTVPSAEQALPVMLWIHGGGNTIGTANTYAGHHLAGDKKVIVVALNYRLGILGWFSHPSLRSTVDEQAPLAELDRSSNYALLDMIAALQWIQQNVANFGGDPNNITIFGESAGGRDVYALLGSPLAKGLFQRAVVQSGSVRSATLSQAENYTDDDEPGHAHSSRELLARLLLADATVNDRSEAKAHPIARGEEITASYLRSKSMEELFAVLDKGAIGEYEAPNIIRDGIVVASGQLMDVLTDSANYNAVPIMMGSNRDENKAFMAEDSQFIGKRFGVLPQIIDLQAYNRRAAYLSDQWKALSVDEPAARLHRSQPGQIFAYRFDWDEAPSNWLVDFPNLLGAGHGLDVAYVFGDFEGGISLPFLLTEDNKPGRLALSAAMMDYWAEFAYSGNPGRGRSGKQPQWTAWQTAGNKMLLLDTPAGGGPRMSSEGVNAQDLKQRLLADAALVTQEERCSLYKRLFLESWQTDYFWDEQEYLALGEDGCADTKTVN